MNSMQYQIEWTTGKDIQESSRLEESEEVFIK